MLCLIFVGMFSSRITLQNMKFDKVEVEKHLDKIENHCMIMVNDIHLALNESRIRYNLVRYEDIALDPTSYAKSIYKVVKFPYNEFVDSWVKKSTTSVNSSQIDNPYGTSRNSTEAAFSWLDHLSLNLTREVESRCERAMTLLGYRRLSLEETTNNRIDLVLEKVPEKVKTLLVK